MVEREFLDKSKLVERYGPLPSGALKKCIHVKNKRFKPDTRLPQPRVVGQGLYLRSLDYLGRSSEAKDRNRKKQTKKDGRTDRQTDRRTDGPTKRGVESRSARLKTGRGQDPKQQNENSFLFKPSPC